MTPVDTGELVGRYPYARVGTGSEPLVVVPGIDDAMFSGRYTHGLAWSLYWYFSRFVEDYRVYVISRPRGLGDDVTIEAMADGYGRVLEVEIGTANLLGVSMGGMIAQTLSAERPALVDALVLANSGTRLVDRDTLERFIEYASDRDWASIRAELSAAMFSDWRTLSYPPIALTIGRFVLPKPAEPGDVANSLEAIGAFDGRPHLGSIEAPTLIFGGTDDPFFPEWILEETATGIPDSRLEAIPGGKHAAFQQWKYTFDGLVEDFLDRSAVASRAAGSRRA